MPGMRTIGDDEMSFVKDKDKNRAFWMGLVVFVLISILVAYVVFWASVINSEENQSESITPYLNNSTLSFKNTPQNNILWEIRAVNNNDMQNLSLRVNISHIKEMKEINGTLMIEIRRDIK